MLLPKVHVFHLLQEENHVLGKAEDEEKHLRWLV